MLSRIVLFCAVVAVASSSPAAAATADVGRTSVVAAFYPLAYAAERSRREGIAVGDLTPPGAEPHDLELTAARRRAARATPTLVALCGRRLPARRRGRARRAAPDGRSTSSTRSELLTGRRIDHGASRRPRASAEELDPHVWLDPLRYAAVARAIAAALGRPHARGPASSQRLEALDRSSHDGLARLQAARDRDESRRVRVPGRPVRPRADPARRALTRGRAEREASSKSSSRRCGDRCDDGLLRDARLAAARRDGRARGGREDGGARPARGPDAGAGAPTAPTTSTVMRENLAALRQALGCT